MKLPESDKDSLRQQAHDDLYFFAKGILGFDWFVPHIHVHLCEMLEKYVTDRRIRIVLPRGWLKTTLCSCAYPLWRAIRDPNVRVLIAQNTYTNACMKLLRIRKLVEENGLFRTLWPELLPDSSCVWKADALCLKRDGAFDESTFQAAGIRTQITTRHFDVIVEDDTVAPDLDDLGENNLCPTKDDIEQAIGWHRLVPPLLVNPSKSQILVVGTRWFEKDLHSWIGENEPSYKTYERACRERDGVMDSDGDVTYPERFNAETLDELEAALGPYMFSCLYMNLPMRSDNMMFQPHWIKYYDTEPKRVMCYTTVDPAGDPEDTKGDPDWNVVMTTGKDLYTGRIYVLDYTRKRCNPGELIAGIFAHVRRYKPVKVGIEAVQYQRSLQYWIRERMRKDNIYFLVEGLTHGRRSKGSRIMGLQPVVASGMLLFRKWMHELISEMLSFPLGSNDDLIDALSMQLPMWAQTQMSQKPSQSDETDPMSLDGIIAELHGRHKSKSSMVMDMLDTAPDPMVFDHSNFELSRTS